MNVFINSSLNYFDDYLEHLFQVMMNDDLPPPEDDESSDTNVISLPPPKMSINVRSSDSLEMTMSKTCLEVLNNLGKVRMTEQSCDIGDKQFQLMNITVFVIGGF